MPKKWSCFIPTAGAPWEEQENCFQRGKHTGTGAVPLQPYPRGGGQDVPAAGGTVGRSAGGRARAAALPCTSLGLRNGNSQRKSRSRISLQTFMPTSLRSLVRCCHTKQSPSAVPELRWRGGSGQRMTVALDCIHPLSCFSPLNRKEEKNKSSNCRHRKLCLELRDQQTRQRTNVFSYCSWASSDLSQVYPILPPSSQRWICPIRQCWQVLGCFPVPC